SRKRNLEHCLPLLPVHIGGEVDSRRPGIDRNSLDHAAPLADAPAKLDNCPFGPALAHIHPFEGLDIVGFRGVEGVDVPGSVIERLVVENHQSIRTPAGGHYLAPEALVAQPRHASALIELDVPELRIKLV